MPLQISRLPISRYESYCNPPPPTHTHTFIHSTTNIQVLSKPLLSQQLSLLQERLRVGWGTARVAVGMGFTSHVYEYCKYGTEGKAGRQLRRRLTGRAPEPEEGEGEDDEEDGGPVPVVPDSE